MLNVKGWLKKSEDEHTVKMVHEKGHEMNILLKPLKPIEREQLKRLKMSEGGKVQKFSDAGEVNPPTQDQSQDDSPSGDSGGQPTTPVTTPAAGGNTNIYIGGQPAAQPAPPPAQPEQVKMDTPNVPTPAAVAPSQNAATPAGAAALPSQALNQQEQSANVGQQIGTAQAKINEQKAQQDYNNLVSQNARLEQNRKEIDQHTTDAANIVNDRRNNNPNQMYEDMTVPGRISTALGILLGGVAGKGNGNVVLDYLKDQQEKDIASQQHRKESANTVLGAYQNLYKNNNAAIEATAATWNKMAAAKANQMAASLGTPQAYAANLQLQAKFKQDNYEHLQKAAYLTNQPSASPQGPAAGAPSVEPSGGQSVKSKFGQGTADTEGLYTPEPILKPGAAQILDDQQKRAAAGDPAAAANLPRLQEQYAKAQRADEVLARARDIYTELVNKATPGGWTGRQLEHTHLEGLPGIAGAVGSIASGAGNLIEGGYTGVRKGLAAAGAPIGYEDEFSKNRQYETARQKLGDLLRSVFPGIGGGEYNSKLNAIVPDYEDKPADITKKIKAFEDLIKTSGEFNVIKNEGLAN